MEIEEKTFLDYVYFAGAIKKLHKLRELNLSFILLNDYLCKAFRILNNRDDKFQILKI